MKAETTSIQNLVQTLKTLKGIWTRGAAEQALHPDHSTIGTVQSSKNGRIYTTLTRRLLRNIAPFLQKKGQNPLS